MKENSSGELNDNILIFCPIPTWSSTHALGLLKKLGYNASNTHFIIGSYLERFDTNGVEEYKFAVSRLLNCNVYAAIYYKDNDELYAKFIFLIKKFCENNKGGKVFLPNHIFSFFNRIDPCSLSNLTTLIEKSYMRLYAYDHGPGDSIDFFDNKTKYALSFAEKIYLSTASTYPLSDEVFAKKLEVIAPSYFAEVIDSLSILQQPQIEKIRVNEPKGRRNILIIGGTYDHLIGSVCNDSFLYLINACVDNDYICYFKPHKHQYHKDQLHWLDKLKEAGAVIIDDIGCTAEVLANSLRTTAVFSVCSSTLHHCWNYLNIPVFTMSGQDVINDLLLNSENALGGNTIKEDSYRFLEVMLSAMKFPYYDLFLKKLSNPSELRQLCIDAEQNFERSELTRSALYLRESSSLNKQSKLSHLVGEHDSYYLDAVLTCQNSKLVYAVYGTGQGGVDCNRVASKVGYTPKLYIDREVNTDFQNKYNVVVKCIDEFRNSVNVDVILVSSITFCNEISAQISNFEELSKLKVITINHSI